MESLTRNLSYILPGALVLLLILIFSGIALLNVLIVICSVFLICLVLIQRGRGGGLAGAFGGMGGSSAFGTKAGDVFTWTTIVTACVWFLIAMRLVMVTNSASMASSYTGKGTPTRAAATKDGVTPSTAPKTSPDAAPSSEKSTVPAPGGGAGAGLPSALEDEAAPKKVSEPTKTSP